MNTVTKLFFSIHDREKIFGAIIDSNYDIEIVDTEVLILLKLKSE